jgi:hypothetical protein
LRNAKRGRRRSIAAFDKQQSGIDEEKNYQRHCIGRDQEAVEGHEESGCEDYRPCHECGENRRARKGINATNRLRNRPMLAP